MDKPFSPCFIAEQLWKDVLQKTRYFLKLYFDYASLLTFTMLRLSLSWSDFCQIHKHLNPAQCAIFKIALF